MVSWIETSTLRHAMQCTPNLTILSGAQRPADGLTMDPCSGTLQQACWSCTRDVRCSVEAMGTEVDAIKPCCRCNVTHAGVRP